MKLSATLAAAALLSLPQSAWAAASCYDTVNASYVTIGGAVIIRGLWRNDYTQICDLKTEWKGVTPDICASWKAMADAAVSVGRPLNLYYPDATSCAAIPTFGSAPAPQYVMLYFD